MKLRLFVCLAFAAVCCGVMPTGASAQAALVADGKSTFTIVLPANAPTSVQNAAAELQKDIELATGAKLALQKDDAQIGSTPILSVGSTRQAKAAGISSEKMADESFRIVTQNGNLYILGPDTPDGGWTKNNGTSNGTANGVYTFLEDYLGVRWLMPGELGRDVPRRSTLALEKIDRSITPQFNLRHVTQITGYTTASQYASISAWMERQKQGGATDWDFNHNWWRTLNRTSETPRKGGYYPWAGGAEPNTPEVKKIYAAHPEWFAMDKNGQRPFPKSHYYKLETTNPELVQWFAEQAVKTMKASERPIAFSLSPSDGSQWSESPESKALYDPSPDGGFDPEAPQGGASMSSLVLKWYHDIAQIVAKEYPQGKLTGYIYSSYIYPPQKVSAKLPDNFTPQIATSRAYGYGLYREDVQNYFRTVTDAWARIVTGDWYYYDLPTQILRQSTAGVGGKDVNFPGSTGLVTPAAPEIVNFIFPQLLKSHITGANIYGVASWSNAALSNYILAKMEWDPTLNANDLQKEWLHRAYGEQAGAAMEQFYAKLDDWFREYYRANEKARYELQLEMLRDLYGAHYAEMEKLFLQAKAQPMTDVQKRRLQMIEDNLVVLQWRLRNLHYLPKDLKSPLQRSNAQISDLIAQENADFAIFPGVTANSANTRGKPLPWKVQLAKEAAGAESTLPPWKDDQVLIYAAKAGDIRITPQMVTHGAYFAAYKISDQKGRLVKSGIFDTATPIVIPAKAGESFLLTTPLRKPANFQLQVQNAAVATGDLREGTLYLSGKDAPVYLFYIPGENPVGVTDSDGGAKIRKPYSSALVENYMKEGYTRKNKDGRILNIFDEGWLFSPDPKDDGVARGVLKADFDDSSWTPISPLDWWQMQGFTDYHGPAWYRIKFEGTPLKKGEVARFFFGAVDGNTEIYLNGRKIGEHLLGPDFAGWDKAFTAIATRDLKPGENILVVKVTSKNDTTASGIYKPVALIAGVPK